MGVEQGSLKEGSALRLKNVLGTTINPATYDAQTDGSQKTQLVDSDNINFDIQNPLPTDGDSVYVKDIDLDRSTSTGWTGNISDVFNSPNDENGIYNDTATNPKIITLYFNRTLYLNAIGFGCILTGKTFSNVKLEFFGSDGSVRKTEDFSADSTARGTKTYSFKDSIICVGVKISFVTANTIGLSNITIRKESEVSSRIKSISDSYGFFSSNTPNEELRTIVPVRLVGSTFVGTTVDPNFVTTTLANNGTATQANGQITLATGTTANGSVIATSVRSARYNGGSANRTRAVIRFPDTGTVNNTRKWGCFNATDGMYFKLSGTTLSVCTFKGGSETAVASSNWNGNAFLMDTNVHRWEIYYNNSSVWFAIDGVLVHTISSATTTYSNTLNLPIRTENINSGDSITNVTMEIRVATIYRLGNLETQPTSKYQAGTTAGVVCKYGAGNLRGIIISGVVNNATVDLYDNTAASGTLLWSSGAMTNQTIPFDLQFQSMPFSIGLTMVISAANCNALVIYE